MQRWHLAFFSWVNSGSFFFFPPPPFTKDLKWLFLCLCREMNRSGCKWKELLFIHKQGASSQASSQQVSLGYTRWEQNAKQHPWGFYQAALLALLVGSCSPQGSLFIVPVVFFFLVFFFLHMKWEFAVKRTKPKHYVSRSTWQMCIWQFHKTS